MPFEPVSITPYPSFDLKNIVPHVTEHTARGERGMDIWSRLLQERIIFVMGEIDDFLANSIIAQMLFLEKSDPDREILLYINSPGGSVYGGLAIYSTMQTISCEVETYCIGMAMSMGAILLAGGTKGRRFGLPYSRILIHQPWTQRSAGGTATDIEIHAREIIRMKQELNDILAMHTGQTTERVQKDTDRDFYMSPAEAKDYGLIDHIIESKKKPLSGA